MIRLARRQTGPRFQWGQVMTILYVTDPRATVRDAGDGLAVTTREAPGESGPADVPSRTATSTALRVGLHRLEAVVLVGRAHITAEAMRACAAAGVAIVLMDRGGRVQARMIPDAGRSADLRMLQYAVCRDPGARLERAVRIVQAKLANAVAVLVERQSNEPATANPALPEAIAALKERVRAVSSAGSRDVLLGHEGFAARLYFQALATAFRGPIRFSGRASRPSPDPANALLSLGYTMLATLLAGRIEARGLDPALGLFHEIHPGRPSLALDLLEELRHPIVDRFVTRVCNLRIFRPEHFEPDLDRPGGVRLVGPALKRFFREWEEFLAQPPRGAWRDHPADRNPPDTATPAAGSRGRASAPSLLDVRGLIDRQVERLAADLRGGPIYGPFRYGEPDDHGDGS
ncbi:MAG: CRISPR-associated endonuclease Cas1 [Isosphaeraceae bacterium]